MKRTRIALLMLALALILGVGTAFASETVENTTPGTAPQWTAETEAEETAGVCDDAQAGRFTASGLCNEECNLACWAIFEQCVDACAGQGFLCKLACVDERTLCSQGCGCP